LAIFEPLEVFASFTQLPGEGRGGQGTLLGLKRNAVALAEQCFLPMAHFPFSNPLVLSTSISSVQVPNDIAACLIRFRRYTQRSLITAQGPNCAQVQINASTEIPQNCGLKNRTPQIKLFYKQYTTISLGRIQMSAHLPGTQNTAVKTAQVCGIWVRIPGSLPSDLWGRRPPSPVSPPLASQIPAEPTNQTVASIAGGGGW